MLFGNRFDFVSFRRQSIFIESRAKKILQICPVSKEPCLHALNHQMAIRIIGIFWLIPLISLAIF